MLEPGRSYSAGNQYRYGFNGKENDNEVKGEGNQQDYGKRIYDPRIGRFLSVDPLMKGYPMLTPYQFASNTPISAIDLDGLEGKYYCEILQKADGTTQIRKITYELDVYVVTGTKGDYSSSYTVDDITKVNESLCLGIGNDVYIDPDTKAIVDFKFNVKYVDFSSVIKQQKKDGTFKEKVVNRKFSDNEVRSEMFNRGENLDGYVTLPAFLIQQPTPGTDGGRNAGAAIALDPKPNESEEGTISHEILHFMLSLYAIVGRSTNDLHHDLGGWLGRPFTTPSINDDILRKLKEFVPRSYKDDKIITEQRQKVEIPDEIKWER